MKIELWDMDEPYELIIGLHGRWKGHGENQA